jgi:hypothetical protein
MPRCMSLLVMLLAACVQARAADPVLVTARAELLHAIDARNLKAGDSFFLKLTGLWQQAGCTVPANATVEGVVAQVMQGAKGGQRAGLAVRFAPVACSGSEALTVTPLLIAMQAPAQGVDESLRRMNTAAQEQHTIVEMFGPPRVTDRLLNTADKTQQQYNTTGWDGGAHDPPLKTGEVSGIRGVKMVLPEASTTTTLESSHAIALERKTQFVLTFVPIRKATQEVAREQREPFATASSSSLREPSEAAEAKAVSKNPEPPDAPERCAAGGCTQMAATSDAAAHRAEWLLPLAALGLQPQAGETLTSLDDDDGLQFLGENELLLTYNPHRLVRRTAEEAALGLRPRQIRAFVLDRTTGRVLKERDWSVPESDGPYSWSLGDGRVLVHVADELVMYGADLVPQHRYKLPGPLLFASVAPRGDSVLVATVHERHTSEEHKRLVAFLGPDWPVEEDYDLTALGRDLEVLGAHRMSVEPFEPALLTAAMVSAQPGHGNHWQIREDSWGAASKVLAQYRSGCGVEVESLPGNLLFAHGCDASRAELPWYRVLTPEGATMLKGSAPAFALVQQSVSDAAGRVLALAVSQFDKRIDLAGGMHESEFQHLSVSVYDTATGKLLFAVQPTEGSCMQQSVALAPSGSSMAVLTAGEVALYAIPQAVAENRGETKPGQPAVLTK